jgi:hypothetical protein
MKFCRSKPLRALYQKLTEYLGIVEDLIPRLQHLDQCASAVVLEDDLDCLVEECEELMIAGVDVRSREVLSLESRALTIIEEVECLVSRHNSIAAVLKSQEGNATLYS